MSCAAGPHDVHIDLSIARTRPPIVLLGDDDSRQSIRRMLETHPNISCPPGNSFLVYLGRVTKQLRPQLGDFVRAEPTWAARVAGFFGSIQAGYAAAMGKERWAAEVPGHEIGKLDRFFPTAQVLYAVDPGNHTSDVRAGRRAGARMAPGRYLEIRSRDLVVQPERTARALVEFLGEAWHDDVLRGVVAAPVQ
jgi:hypothetical protein